MKNEQKNNFSIKIKMKLKLLAILITLMLFIQSKCSKIKIEHIEFLDLNDMPMNNHFPVYFKCNFIALHHKFKILFQRKQNKINLLVNNNQTNFFSYESVKVILNTNLNDKFKANAVLFLNEISFYENKTTKIAGNRLELIKVKSCIVSFASGSGSQNLAVELLLNVFF